MLFRIDDIPILYEDTEILVLNKPAGIAVIHERYEKGELSLLELLTERGGSSGGQTMNPVQFRDQAYSTPLDSPIRPIHRIDKETSGVVLFAKTEEAFRGLSLQFQERTLTKIYHALVAGRPGWVEQNCDALLLVDGDRRHRTIVHREGKPSHTLLRVLETFRDFALVEAQPKTGRTHQIRAHLSYLGHSIVGDALYGGGEGLFLSAFKRGYKGLRPIAVNSERGGGREKEASRSVEVEKPLIGRLALHALSLECWHPRTGASLRFEAPYPKDLTVALKQLRKYGK